MKKAKEQTYRLEDVLDAWNYMGRSGLTVHALCTLTGIPPQKLMKILRKSRDISVDICGEILAPVIFTLQYGDGDDFTVKLNNLYLDAAEAQLKKWPWPKYKGMSNGQGTTQPMNPRDLAVLKMHLASKGEDQEYATRH